MQKIYEKTNIMKAKFIGAIEGVTGSCTILEFTSNNVTKYILIDCGMEQEEGVINSIHFPFEASKLDWVFLTHAHLDHCGKLPLLYKAGYTGKVFCTRATMDISNEILLDSSKISGLYSQEDVNKINFSPIDTHGKFKFGQHIILDDNLVYHVLRSSHVLGSIQICIQWRESELVQNAITFSGDLGASRKFHKQSLLLKDNMFPFNSYNGKDIIILESTYGDRSREQFGIVDRHKKLSLIINESLSLNSKSGTIVFPAFAFHRSQEILVDILSICEKEEFYCPFDPEYIEDCFTNNNFTKMIVESYNNIYNDGSSLFYPVDNNKYEIKDIDSLSEIEIKKIKGLKLKYTINLNLMSSLAAELFPIYDRELTNTIMKNGEIKYLFSTIGKEGYPTEDFIHKIFKAPKPQKRQKNCSVVKFGQCNFKISQDKENKEHKYSKKIIITSSGMCDKGKIQEILPDNLIDENSTIVLTGYQAEGTAGHVLANLEKLKESNSQDEMYNTTLLGYDIRLSDIKCRVVNMSKYYSGHASQQDLVNYVFDNPKAPRSRPPQVILNHGSNSAREELGRLIDNRNSNLSDDFPKTIIPTKIDSSMWLNLNTSKWEDIISSIDKISTLPLEDTQTIKMPSPLDDISGKTNKLIPELKLEILTGLISETNMSVLKKIQQLLN